MPLYISVCGVYHTLCRSLPIHSLLQALLDDFDYSDDEEESLEKKMASQPNQQQDGNPQDTGYVPFSAYRIVG